MFCGLCSCRGQYGEHRQLTVSSSVKLPETFFQLINDWDPHRPWKSLNIHEQYPKPAVTWTSYLLWIIPSSIEFGRSIGTSSSQSVEPAAVDVDANIRLFRISSCVKVASRWCVRQNTWNRGVGYKTEQYSGSVRRSQWDGSKSLWSWSIWTIDHVNVYQVLINSRLYMIYFTTKWPRWFVGGSHAHIYILFRSWFPPTSIK